MSNYGNRNSKMPDVSPKSRSDFSVRNRTIAIMLLAALVAVIVLGFGALDVKHDDEVKKATATVKEKEAKFLEAAAKVAEREKELDTREATLKRRETALETAEANLEEEKNALAEEKVTLAREREIFYSGQLRVYELSKALYGELAPYYEPADGPIKSE